MHRKAAHTDENNAAIKVRQICRELTDVGDCKLRKVAHIEENNYKALDSK